MSKVLLVEDELTLAGIVRDALETMDFTVSIAGDGSEGLLKYFELHPDILIVDVMMPKMSGFDMVKAIRQSDKATPILFLTAKTTVDDVVTGFNLGANDYLRKPFAIPELVVRMKALLTRADANRQEPSPVQTLGAYRFDATEGLLTNIPSGKTVKLPAREADILLRLSQQRGTLVPTRNLLLDLWGDDDFFNARSLQVLITRLRHRLSADPALQILNIRGSGYKLIAE